MRHYHMLVLVFKLIPKMLKYIKRRNDHLFLLSIKFKFLFSLGMCYKDGIKALNLFYIDYDNVIYIVDSVLNCLFSENGELCFKFFRL